MGTIVQLILISFIKVYRLSFSRVLPLACRFHPSCSQYAIEAISIHGPFKGLRLALIRIFKCNPLFEAGIDKVPIGDKK